MTNRRWQELVVTFFCCKNLCPKATKLRQTYKCQHRAREFKQRLSPRIKNLLSKKRVKQTQVTQYKALQKNNSS